MFAQIHLSEPEGDILLFLTGKLYSSRSAKQRSPVTSFPTAGSQSADSDAIRRLPAPYAVTLVWSVQGKRRSTRRARSCTSG